MPGRKAERVRDWAGARGAGRMPAGRDPHPHFFLSAPPPRRPGFVGKPDNLPRTRRSSLSLLTNTPSLIIQNKMPVAETPLVLITGVSGFLGTATA